MKDSESGDKSSTTDSNASQTDNGNCSDQKENGIETEDPQGIVEDKKNL